MNIRTLCLVSLAGLASSAAAQDSVAPAGIGANDAIDSDTASGQVTAYVVDMDTFSSTKGNTYAIAPIAKTSRNNSGTFTTAINSGQGISRVGTTGLLFGDQFSQWTGSIGAGVNSQVNSAGQMVTAPANVAGYTFGFSDFNDAGNHVINGQLAFDPANPTRLYVNRVVTASGNLNVAINHSQVDANGTVAVRGDGNGASGPDVLFATRFYRFDFANRDGSIVNTLGRSSGENDAAASTVVREEFSQTISMVSSVPAAVGGPNMFAPTFNSTIRVNDLASETGAHLGAAGDHRAGIAVLPEPFYNAGDAITAGILSKDDFDQTTAISVWGADGSGVVNGAGTRYASPATITDPTTGVDIFRGEHMFTRSQAAFSNNPPVSLARDADGNLLIATICETVSVPTANVPDVNPQAFTMATLVARVSPQDTATADWSVAGYVDINGINNFGKLISDDSGVVFAELSTLFDDTGDAGPTQGAPSFDSAGNVYWVQPVRFYEGDGLAFTDDDVIRTSLIRANYIADTGSDNDGDGTNDFGYELEIIVSAGDTFESANTGLNYNLFSFFIADGDSSSNGGFFHNNVTSVPSPVNGIDDDSLGGLVLAATVAYDVNDNGTTFDDPDDQTYRTLVYIHPVPAEVTITDCNGNGIEDATDIADGTSTDRDGNGVPDDCQTPTRLCADQNDDGVLNGADFNAWLANFSQNRLEADVNGDNNLNGADFNAWLAAFSQGPNGPLCLP